jgi:predicted DNA-binding transcriptional regulator YafY
MSNIEVTDKPFNRIDYKTADIDHLDDTAASDRIDIRLSVSSRARVRIYDEFAKNDITINSDGTFTLRMNEGRWIYDYILSYGAAVEVLEPRNVRDEMLLLANKIKDKYSVKS